MRYPLLLLIFFLITWFALALFPLDKETWLLENLLIFAWVPLIIWSYFKNRVSNFSYTLIFIFLILHSIGSHYTYSKVPIGYTISTWFGSTRNHYDRVLHFLFGFLLFYPFREWVKIKYRLNKVLELLFPALIVIVLNDMYELVEWVTAILVAPEQGTAFLGTSGDEWDAQKDMALGTLGSIIVLLLSLLKKIR